MVRVSFISSDGSRRDAEAEEGAVLLAVAQGADQPLEGTCEGQMACSTCHVIVGAEWFARLQPATADEEDMLDLAAGIARTSRLSCQIVLSDEMDGLEVHIPNVSHDMRLD